MQLQLNMQNCINSYYHSDKILVFQLKLMQRMCQYLFENAAVANWQRVRFVLCKLHFNSNLFCILWHRPIKSQRSASLSKSHVIWMSFGRLFHAINSLCGHTISGLYFICSNLFFWITQYFISEYEGRTMHYSKLKILLVEQSPSSPSSLNLNFNGSQRDLFSEW